MMQLCSVAAAIIAVHSLATKEMMMRNGPKTGRILFTAARLVTREIRRLLLVTIAGVLAGGALQAKQPEVIGHWGYRPGQISLPSWRAQWIWMPKDVDNDMLLARKVFMLPNKPERVVLSITASAQYQLFINGNYVGRGPARCAPHHQSFDVLDVTKTLLEGKNVLAIRVHYQREGVSYYGSSRAGLLAQLDCTSGTQDFTIQTDAGWRVHPDERWLNASPRMARVHLEVCDRMDLRRKIGAWTHLDFDDSGWRKARVLRRETGWPLPQKHDRPSHLVPPWTSLVARNIPYLVETTVHAPRPVYVGSIPAVKGGEDLSGDHWIDSAVISRIPVPRDAALPNGRQSAINAATDRPIVLPANEPGQCRVIVYNLGAVQNGRPFLDIAGPAGTVVDIMSAPYLLDESLQSPIAASTYVDRIVLSGERERWEAFYMKPVRWLAVVFRQLSGDVRLYGAGIMRSRYPFEQKGYFRTPDDSELETLWNAAAKTIQVCTTDAYTDNYRERRQYAQTSYYACLGNYSVFGDYALQRRYLTQIEEEQLANGIMPAYAPRHGDDFMVILDSNCFWVRGLHQYLLYSGDRTTARELLPAARKLLDVLHSFTNADGLIDSPPYPYWLDHAVNDRRGANFCLNGHYLGAIEDFAQVLQWLDAPGADTYRQRAERIRRALREEFWDPEKQLFADALVDAERSDQFSEHANAIALALRIATREQMEAVAARLSKNESHDFIRRESGIVMVTPAMSYFLHAGLCEAGYADASWDLLQSRFAHMLTPQSNETLWEEWWLDGTGRSGTFRPIASGRSDAQTESAFPPALFSRYILGIEPTQPGLRDVVLRYYPSRRLLRRRGAIPTPSGLLEVAWDVSPAELKITLQTPRHTTVRVDLASVGMPSQDHVSINNKPPLLDQLKDGAIVLSPGKCVVRIRRQ